MLFLCLYSEIQEIVVFSLLGKKFHSTFSTVNPSFYNLVSVFLLVGWLVGGGSFALFFLGSSCAMVCSKPVL